jgi:hypothetical protein
VPQAGTTGTSPEDAPRDEEILVPAGPVSTPPAQVRAPRRVRMARRAWRVLNPRTWRRPRWAALPAGRHERRAASPAATAGAPESTDSPEGELATMETGRTSDE